ncbi:SRPBCC family protein [Nocardia sp. NPDC051832]|uniref:SRPBCC family protein n=1 Tax=Nocardia sp. NPDC051832 TaxID=3155673 RepID=UPI0034216A60
MAWVKREIVIEAPVEDVWAYIGDFEQGPARMSPSLVTECRPDGPEVRVVTFVTGVVVRERLISYDAAEHRYAFSIIGDTVHPEHDTASMQAIALDNGSGERSRFVWMHDVLPAELADAFGSFMDQAIAEFKKTVESERA